MTSLPFLCVPLMAKLNPLIVSPSHCLLQAIMSGTGRRSAYRKHITEGVLNSFPEPKVEKGEEVAQVMQSRGGNILQIVVGSGEESLAILPTKFRKLIWVKRGDYLIVSSASHDFVTSAGDKGKVKYMVESILYRDQVKHLKEKGLWPEAFTTPTSASASEMDSLEGEASSNVDSIASTDYEAGGALEADEEEEEESEDDMSDLPMNTNRLAKMHMIQDDDSSDEEEDEEEEEDEGDVATAKKGLGGSLLGGGAERRPL